MSFNKQYTPLPPQRLAPVQVTVADWFDLAANSNHTVVTHKTFQGQVLDVRKVGGRPETDVETVVEGRATTSRGSTTDSQTYDTTAFGGFDEPVDTGPVATERLEAEVANRSGTDYTQASANDPYQFYLNYSVRNLSVLEKLRREIPLNDVERQLVEKYNLGERERLGVPPERDPLYEPNLEEKVLKSRNAEVATVDISSTGRSNSVTVLSERVRGDEVLYLTGVSVNGQNYSSSDSVRLAFERNEEGDFYRIETFGLPSMPFEADLHIPVLEDVSVAAFASNTVNNVDVRVEYAKVERTLVEKALYGLENEVAANDSLAERRLSIYQEIRDRLRAGVPINETELLAEAEETPGAEQAATTSRRR